MEQLAFVGLEDKRNDLAENLSYGQQKLLSIACCLAAEPELLMLDEPVSGVQPAMIEKIETVIRELIQRKKTVFLIEHDIEFVLGISDTVVVMDEGCKIAEGTPSLIQSKPEILEAYLS
jgi:ABC-type branched-subunit amino acid transport system ATPase component